MSMRVALFAPCYVDQLYPKVAIATLRVLERLGVEVDVPQGAVCCGQPPANAGFAHEGDPALDRFIDTFKSYDRVVVISGSCALHIRAHGASRGAEGAHVADSVVELCGFLHDDIGVDQLRSLNGTSPLRVALHIGCHALRGLGLARSSELQVPVFDKVSAVLGAIDGVSFARLERWDECCGFGGTFSVSEAAVSSKMGRDRLRDYESSEADLVVSTDVSCMMHLSGLSRARGATLPIMHVSEFLAGSMQ